MATRQSRKLEASGQLQLLRRRKKLNQTVTKLANATKQLRAQLKQKEDKSRSHFFLVFAVGIIVICIPFVLQASENKIRE